MARNERRLAMKCGKGMCLLGVLVMSLPGCMARRREPLSPPLTTLSADADRGRVFFMQTCNKCHPGGEGGLAPALNDKPFQDFLKRSQVRHGLGAMPAFSKT